MKKLLVVIVLALSLGTVWVVRISYPAVASISVPPRETVKVQGASLTLKSVTVADSLPSTGTEKVSYPVPGAVYLVAEFTMSNDSSEDFEGGCSALALGEGERRRWTTAFLMLPEEYGDVCMPSDQGAFTAVMEIPERAVPEIRGIKLTFWEYLDGESLEVEDVGSFTFEGKVE